MSPKTPRIALLGEQGILLQWELKFNEKDIRWLLAVKRFIENNILKENIEVINSYNSLLIKCNTSIDIVYSVFEQLEVVDFESIIPFENNTVIYEIPVCYDDFFALDLQDMSEHKNMSKQQIVNLHCTPVYTVCFMGFLPGFAYLMGMDASLVFSRKRTPRKSIEKGAVDIAGYQTGIYPNASPGGWQIIGNCPVRMFDPKKKQPCILAAGDQLKFKPITINEHEEIKLMSEKGKYQLQTIDNE